MENANKISVSEDEDEDLEALRLAALQTLKKKNAQNEAPQNIGFGHGLEYHENSRFGHKNLRGHPNKRGRFFNHRGGKNGQFNNQPFHNRVRSSNLIAITPIGSESDDIVVRRGTEATPKSPKLTLPQDRYCGKSVQVEKPQEKDKFNRYNNSDASDEDSDYEEALLESDDEKEGELKRSDSLEALMQELDDEIQGKPKAKDEKIVEDVNKVKNKKKKKISESLAETSDLATEIPPKTEVIPEIEPEPIRSSPERPKIAEEKPKIDKTHSSPPHKKFRRSPPARRNFPNKRKPWAFQNQTFVQNPPFLPQIFPTLPPVMPPAFNPTILPSQPPPFFERPISPLTINADTLTTQTLAPLSPRSAAFVLENRAIIEKRKRSPRRSYSRSPSPRLRRSSSPRGPRSPRRSPSPRRKSRSPKRRSLSPRRRSISPKRAKKAGLDSPKAKPSVRGRLGAKSASKIEEEKKETKVELKKEEKTLDPILEARRRKFENKEIKVKEGVIRLRPKEETMPKSDEKQEETNAQPRETNDEESIDEDKLLEDDDFELGPKEAGLYSDDDSGSENEGRFKTKRESSAKVPALSFSKLVNGVKAEIKEVPLPDSSWQTNFGGRPDRSSRRNKSPASSSKRSEERRREERTKPRIVVKSERHPTAIEKRFERKIEIKIKNPGKYERGEKKKEKEEGELEVEEVKVQRKVEVGSRGEDDDSMELVDGEEDTTQNEGDLRAQLSKKRAEKLQKILPSDSVVPSRLLQNALQGAVFKKPKKSKKKELTTSEGKLPIHMRLGFAGNVDMFAEVKPKRKSRKRKNKSNEEQV